ncbi:MAG TPA: glutamyl-tRNA reductase [Gemmatimonadaceae bacterium]|nr:glutamyl-tRNA reductase [Gemmatimonadaceae bacterium]
MGLTVVGVSHRTASVAVRERVAIRPSELPSTAAAAAAVTGSSETVILSTCNRTELYFSGGGNHAAEAGALLSFRAGEDLGAQLYLRRDRDAVSHLFAVTSGLDSMVFGEAQIQGQVRDALAQSRDSAGVVLTRLFHAAGTSASRVRGETRVARGAGSVSSAAVQLAKKIFGSLAGKRAMVLGAGEIAELALECLTAEGVSVGVVANRTHVRAEALASRYNARAMHYDECWAELGSVDLLVCSTAAPRPVVYPELVAPAVKRRSGAPLGVLDIALPRDVAPEVGSLENVFLYDLDDLQAAAMAALDDRREDLPAAERIIAEESDRFWQWLAGLQAVPVLTRVRSEMERLRQEEVAAASRQYGLTESQRETLEVFSRALMNKFLHAPTVRLREAAGNGRGLGVVDAARYLFGVEESADSETDTAGRPPRAEATQAHIQTPEPPEEVK